MVSEDVRWQRRGGRYLPLGWGVTSMLMALLILPSALNLPTTPPTQTLEFSPVPPTDENPDPATGGSIGSLGLGSSSSVPGEAPGTEAPLLPPAGPAPGLGQRPVTKLCVGSPPRQTEDPLSPPCVAHFEGDNGGGTAPGVTATEVRVALAVEGAPDGEERIFDLEDPEQAQAFQDEMGPVFARYAKYFNSRFQMYGRRVHFFAQYLTATASAEQRRASVAELDGAVGPFATLSYLAGNGDAYVTAAAEAGHVVFLGSLALVGNSTVGRPASFFKAHPGRVWGFAPSMETRVDLVASNLCRSVVPHPVSFSGNDDEGQVRKFGLLHTSDTSVPDAIEFAQRLGNRVEECGGEVAATATFEQRYAGIICTEQEAGVTNMAGFQGAGVTTILWTGDTNRCQQDGAGALQYRPEWVVAGDGVMDTNWFSRYADPTVWQHARAVSTFPVAPSLDDQDCVRAVQEASPGETLDPIEMSTACIVYPDYRMLFTGIQVAGPKLDAPSMDKGFHAIPPGPSNDATVPACFFTPGDYTCVKDAQMQWWDPAGDDPDSSQTGCWRNMLAGKRFLADTWPTQDIDTHRTTTDACNSQGPVVVPS